MRLPSKFAAPIYCIVLMVLVGAGTTLRGQTVGFGYVANCGTACGGIGFGSVSMYSIDGHTRRLTPVVPPQIEPRAPQSVTVDRTGRFVYVANGGCIDCGDVSAFSIDGTTGMLTPVPGSPFPVGQFPESVTVDPTGRFVYVANGGSWDVSAYTIDGTTGALTPVAGSPFPAGAGP